MISFGRLYRLHRGLKPARCQLCPEVIVDQDYFALQNASRKNHRTFWRYFHEDCLVPYSKEAMVKKKRKPNGGQKGSRINIPPEVMVDHRKKLRRRAYVLRKLLVETNPSQTYLLAVEYEVLTSWLKENTRVKTFEDQRREGTEHQPAPASVMRNDIRLKEQLEAARTFDPATAAVVKDFTSSQLEGVYYTPGKRRGKEWTTL